MKLEKEEVYSEFLKRGAKEIYHANSVLTSLQFLKKKALLARGKVEEYGLPQTSQSSDKIDKLYGLWLDVFTDNVDIHRRTNGVNLYGPAMFVIDTEIIKEENVKEVWITKTNPTKWGTKDRDRWFNSEEDLSANLTIGTFDYMLVFRNSEGEIPFGKYLKKIVLDDPHLVWKKGNNDIYTSSFEALKLVMTEGELDIPIEKRKCSPTCGCTTFYKNNLNKVRELFRIS